MIQRIGRHRRIIHLIIALFAAGAVWFVAGCDEKSGESAQEPNSAIIKSYQKGPYEVKVRLASDAITIADKLTLELSAAADEGIDVTFPKVQDKLGRFTLAGQTGPESALFNGNRVRHVKTYQLKPFLSGDYMIPPLTVNFAKAGQSKGETREIQTEALDVRVTSVLSKDSSETLKTILPPEPLPEAINPWVAAGLGAAVLLGLGGFIGYRRFRRQKNGIQPEVFRPAHERAEEELEQLFSENLIAAGHYKAFYQRLSAILRRYIENRFGLRAPEQTTDEFLNTMRTANELTAVHKQLLKSFLIHCDQVKFAEHQPAADEVQKMTEACRQFIRETRSPPVAEGDRQKAEAPSDAV